MSDPAPKSKRDLRDPEVFPKISREHAEAIGYVVAHWSLVEGAEVWIIRTLIGREDEAGFAVTAELSAMQRAAVIQTLLDCTREQDWADDWAEITEKAEKLRNRRNDAVHGEWVVAGAEHYAQRTKARGKLLVTFTPVPTGELKALSDEILDLLEDVYALSRKLVLGGAAKILSAPPTKPPLVPGQGRKARAQAEARAQKRAQKDADRQKAKRGGGGQDE